MLVIEEIYKSKGYGIASGNSAHWSPFNREMTHLPATIIAIASPFRRFISFSRLLFRRDASIRKWETYAALVHTCESHCVNLKRENECRVYLLWSWLSLRLVGGYSDGINSEEYLKSLLHTAFGKLNHLLPISDDSKEWYAERYLC